MGACKVDWIGEPFTTDDLAYLYYLIVKKQEGKLSEDEKEELKDYLYRYLCYAKEVFEDWLASHGCLRYEDFVKHFLKYGFAEIARRMCDLESVGYELLDIEPDDVPDELSIPVFEVIPFDITISAYELLENGLSPLYERYRGRVCTQDFARNIQKVYRKLNAFLKHPTGLRDAILLADEVTHTFHYSGNVITTYGNIDVEEAKEEAERALRGEKG